MLFKTENSKHWNDGKFYEEFVYLEPEGAQFLVDAASGWLGSITFRSTSSTPNLIHLISFC